LDEKKFIKLVNGIHNDGIFLLEGEVYKRNKYQRKNEKVTDWYNRKNLYLIRQTDNVNELFSDMLAGKLKADFTTLAPIYHFFIEALHEQFLKSEGFEREQAIIQLTPKVQ